MPSANSHPGDDASAEAPRRAMNGSDPASPPSADPPSNSRRRRSSEPKRPRPAAVGPNGQPLLVREGSQGTHGRGLIIGLSLVLGLAGWILWNAARAATETPDKIKLGKDVIEISRNPDELAKRIEQDGPRLYPGLAGTEADFWLTYVNGEFYAFSARQEDASRACNSQWRPQLGQFEDGCEAGQLYGPTGDGLPPYDAFVEIDGDDKRVYVKLAAPAP